MLCWPALRQDCWQANMQSLLLLCRPVDGKSLGTPAPRLTKVSSHGAIEVAAAEQQHKQQQQGKQQQQQLPLKRVWIGLLRRL